MVKKIFDHKRRLAKKNKGVVELFYIFCTVGYYVKEN
jgi:hypothetical protein